MPMLIVLFALAQPAQVGPLIQTAAGTGVQGDSGDGGPAKLARLNMPFDVAFDSAGNLIFSDTMNHRVRRVDRRTGTITTVAGNGTKGFSGDGAAATGAQLNEPYGVVLDAAGNLYIVDRLNGRIRWVDVRSGVIATIAGNGSGKYAGDGGAATRAV